MNYYIPPQYELRHEIVHEVRQEKLETESKLTLSLLTLSLLTLFCGDPVPVKEMGQAKTSIAQAEFAKADKYAPEKYRQARDTLFASHDLISKGDYKDAKEKAKEAEALAKKAFEGAAPKFAEETWREAKIVLGQAEERYAEQFTQQAEYKNAQDLMASGDRKFSEGKPMEAYADYEKARSEAEKAHNMAEKEEKEKEAKPFAIWKSDSDKVLAIISKLFPHTPRDNDLEIQAQARKKLFEKTLKKINKNLRTNIKLRVVRLKDVSKITDLNTYGKKYKSRLQEKYKRRLMSKYGTKGAKDINWNAFDWNSTTRIAKLVVDYSGNKVFQDILMYKKLIESKLAACKKCYDKPYFGLSFELPMPTGFCSKNSYEYYGEEDYPSYSSASKLLISKEVIPKEEIDEESDTYRCTTEYIIIYAYMNLISEPEFMALKKGALYSLHGELYAVDYKPYGGGTTLEILLKSPKSIKIIE